MGCRSSDERDCGRTRRGNDISAKFARFFEGSCTAALALARTLRCVFSDGAYSLAAVGVRCKADICNPPNYISDAVRVQFARRSLSVARCSALAAGLWQLRCSGYRIVASSALIVYTLWATPRRAAGYAQRAASRRQLLCAMVCACADAHPRLIAI